MVSSLRQIEFYSLMDSIYRISRRHFIWYLPAKYASEGIGCFRQRCLTLIPIAFAVPPVIQYDLRATLTPTSFEWYVLSRHNNFFWWFWFLILIADMSSRYLWRRKAAIYFTPLAHYTLAILERASQPLCFTVCYVVFPVRAAYLSLLYTAWQSFCPKTRAHVFITKCVLYFSLLLCFTYFCDKVYRLIDILHSRLLYWLKMWYWLEHLLFHFHWWDTWRAARLQYKLLKAKIRFEHCRDLFYEIGDISWYFRRPARPASRDVISNFIVTKWCWRVLDASFIMFLYRCRFSMRECQDADNAEIWLLPLSLEGICL